MNYEVSENKTYGYKIEGSIFITDLFIHSYYFYGQSDEEKDQERNNDCR